MTAQCGATPEPSSPALHIVLAAPKRSLNWFREGLGCIEQLGKTDKRITKSFGLLDYQVSSGTA